MGAGGGCEGSCLEDSGKLRKLRLSASVLLPAAERLRFHSLRAIVSMSSNVNTVRMDTLPSTNSRGPSAHQQGVLSQNPTHSTFFFVARSSDHTATRAEKNGPVR